MAKSRREYYRRTRKVRMRELSHSKPGWIGLICGLASGILFWFAVAMSFGRSGEAPFYVGSVGMFALILSVGGLALGILGAVEENIRPIPPRIAIVIGAAMSILLVVLYIFGLI